MAEARGVRVREREAARRRWASAASSAGSACRSGCAGAVEPSAQQGRASAFGTCVPPFFSAAPHSLSTLGVLVERQVLGPRRVADSGSGLGRVPRDADAPGPSSSWEPRPWLGRPLPDRGGLQRSHLAHERALF